MIEFLSFQSDQIVLSKMLITDSWAKSICVEHFIDFSMAKEDGEFRKQTILCYFHMNYLEIIIEVIRYPIHSLVITTLVHS